MSKEQILSRIRAVGMKEQPLPPIPSFGSGKVNLTQMFIKALEANHVEVVPSADRNTSIGIVQESSRGKDRVIDLFTDSACPLPDDPHQLESTDLFVTTSPLGVAENGALWLNEANYQVRALPFIATEVIIVIRALDLVTDMHEAYRKVRTPDGYGLFVTGPSKTADIEQSLVIGAHGPLSMQVIVEG